jgi:hypothetical protein
MLDGVIRANMTRGIPATNVLVSTTHATVMNRIRAMA